MKTKILDFLRLIFKVRFLEQLLVRFTNGKTFGSFITKLPPNHYQYSKSSIREVERQSINYRLDLSDIVDWYIYFGFKETSRQSLLDLMGFGHTIIDIGANVGNVTLETAKIVGSKGKVHSFEPDPENYLRLETNLNLNQFSNIIPNKLGLGDAAGTFMIANVNPNNKGMNRIINENTNNFKSQQIQVITLDNYVFERKLNSVDLIKIDVEGFEYYVLKGGVKVINTFHPTFFIELDDNNLIEQGSSAKELVRLLEECGYAIIHSETKMKIVSSSNFTNCHYDLIAKYIA